MTPDSEVYFPGSRQVVTTPSPLHQAVRKGKVFTIGGREVELFTISQLAYYLNRKPGTIRKWEREGVIPKATYAKGSSDPRGRRRLYSREQVEALVRIAQEEGILTDLHRQITKTQFKAKALSAFKQIARQ